jgi:CPA2 family monovalent cation:H+ antiporter-2
MTISASLAQIGEFSFILVSLGVSLSLMSDRGRDLVLAGAIISIMLNPLWFALLDRYEAKESAEEAAATAAPADEAIAETVAEPPRSRSKRSMPALNCLSRRSVMWCWLDMAVSAALLARR